jgi:HNH endonuclease
MSKTYVSASLRRMVFDRADGNCEYCLIPESLALASHQVDHAVSEKHGGETVSENLALSCSFCNQAKGSDVGSIDAETGEYIRLYHPRRDRWVDHFQINQETGEILGMSAIGRVTVRLLQMNRSAYLPERLLLLQAGVLVVPGIVD